MDKKELSKRWENIDTEALVEAAITGNGKGEALTEARKLMEDTIATRQE